jgi:transcriptional regulator with XRE-family HTH domain
MVENRDDETAIRVLADLTHQERLVIGLERIKALRGWKNKHLAAKLGVTEGYMSQVIRGMRDVKLTMLDKMTRELDVTTYDLFDVSEEDLQLSHRRKERRRLKKKMQVDSHRDLVSG